MSTVPDVYVAQSFAEPPFACPLRCVPTAYSFAEYSLVSTELTVSVAHSLDAPALDVSVTPVPPIAHALDE